MTPLTAEEIEAAAKGYHKPFTDYVEGEPGERFVLPETERLKIETWCRPFMDAGIEIGGAFVFHVDGSELVIERAYCNGGNSRFKRTTIDIDAGHLLEKIQRDYPDLQTFLSDRVGFWHLHPGYYGSAILSQGDVTEIHKSLTDAGCTPEMGVGLAQLLVYGDPRNGKFSYGGFNVLLDKAFRFPVTIAQNGYSN